MPSLDLPVMGPPLRKIAVARFCRTMSTLSRSGVPILDGLDITARTSGNAIIEEGIMTTRKSIECGETIAAPLKQTGVFPPMVVQMIWVGEATARSTPCSRKLPSSTKRKWTPPWPAC